MLTIRDQQQEQMAGAAPGQQVIRPCDQTKTWIEIQLVDEDQNGVAGVKYRVRLPDASIREGTLDKDGLARIDGILPGQCEISFPEIDGREWKPAGAAATSPAAGSSAPPTQPTDSQQP